MSTTTTTHETVSTDAPTTDTDDVHDALAAIVAQTVPLRDELPAYEEFEAVCDVTRGSIRAAAGGEI